MKNTGVIRRIDGLGRIVIPKDIREWAGIKEDDPLEISFDGGKIVLELYKPAVSLSFPALKQDWDNMTKQERKNLMTELISHIDD